MSSKLSQQMKAHLDSEEGKAKLKAYFDKLKFEDNLKDIWCKKFNNLSLEKRDEIIKKILSKYNSDEYKDRWYNRGIMPPEDLTYMIYEYASRYGKESYSDGFFDSDWYEFDNYKVTLICGQGSFVRIEGL